MLRCIDVTSVSGVMSTSTVIYMYISTYADHTYEVAPLVGTSATNETGDE